MAEPRNILIVEDEPLIAMMLEDFVESLGHRPAGSADNIDSAQAAIEEGGFDLAILDVNVQGKTIWPVARALRERSIPFVIATGGHVEPPPPEFKGVPQLAKPYTLDGVAQVIDAACASA